MVGLSLLYYYNGDKGYIISIDHSESFSIPIKKVKEFIAKHRIVHVFDKKFHSYYLDHTNLSDLCFPILRDQGKADIKVLRTKTESDIENRLRLDKDINKIIPIVKHYEHMENLVLEYEMYLNPLPKDKVEDYGVPEAYKFVEESGIGVHKEDFLSIYGVSNPQLFNDKGSSVYTKYNLYNTTGRPTNSFNGVNFLAIPKNEEHRSPIVPTNDLLVEFDFDGYHLRLLANEIGYEFSKESIHEQLGKIYFKKDEITQEEYKKSKEITFRKLYGYDSEGIELFEKVRAFEDFLWSKYKKDGGIILPTGIRINRSKDLTKNVLFNYYVQNLETLSNAKKILALKEILTGKKTKLVLITYDAFLFDFSYKDGKSLLMKIKGLLEYGNTLTKHKFGVDYNLSGV